MKPFPMESSDDGGATWDRYTEDECREAFDVIVKMIPFEGLVNRCLLYLNGGTSRSPCGQCLVRRVR